MKTRRRAGQKQVHGQDPPRGRGASPRGKCLSTGTARTYGDPVSEQPNVEYGDLRPRPRQRDPAHRRRLRRARHRDRGHRRPRRDGRLHRAAGARHRHRAADGRRHLPDPARGRALRPGDVDLSMYSLRKYLRLATKGNPTALLPLWCPEESVIHRDAARRGAARLRDGVPVPAGRRAVPGLHARPARADAGPRQAEPGAQPARADRAVRLGRQVRLPRAAAGLPGPRDRRMGRLTLPLPERARAGAGGQARRGAPRRGVAEIPASEAGFAALLDEGRTPLPPSADLDRITAWAIEAQRRHWGW